MIKFNCGCNTMLFAMQDIYKKGQTYLYDERNYKYLIYVDIDNNLRCCRCLGNIEHNLSLKTSLAVVRYDNKKVREVVGVVDYLKGVNAL